MFQAQGMYTLNYQCGRQKLISTHLVKIESCAVRNLTQTLKDEWIYCKILIFDMNKWPFQYHALNTVKKYEIYNLPWNFNC